MWSRITGIASAVTAGLQDETPEGEDNKSTGADVSSRDHNDPSDLAVQLMEQERLVLQLKEMVRERETSLHSRDTELKKVSAELSKVKLQAKAKLANLTQQLEEAKMTAANTLERVRPSDVMWAYQLKATLHWLSRAAALTESLHKSRGMSGSNDSDESVSTSTSDISSSIVDQKTRARLQVVKKKLKDRERQMAEKDAELMQQRGEIQARVNVVTERDEVIKSLTERLNEASTKVEASLKAGDGVDTDQLYSQIVYKDRRILDLDSRINDLEKTLIDLRELVSEKEEVIRGRDKAIHLLRSTIEEKESCVHDQVLVIATLATKLEHAEKIINGAAEESATECGAMFDLTAESAVLARSLSSKTAECDELVKKLALTNKDVERLSNTIISYENELATLREISALRTNVRPDDQSDVEVAEEGKDSVNTVKESTVMSDNAEDMKHLYSELEQLRLEVTQSRNECQSAHEELLAKSIVLITVEASSAEKNKVISDLELSIGKKDEELRRNRSKLEERMGLVRSLQDLLDVTNRSMLDMQETLTRKTAENEELRSEMDKILQSREYSDKDFRKASDTLFPGFTGTDFGEQVVIRDDEHAMCEEKLRHFVKELSVKDDMLRAANSKVSEIKGLVSEKELVISEITSQLDFTNQVVVERTQECIALRSQIEEYKIKVTEKLDVGDSTAYIPDFEALRAQVEFLSNEIAVKNNRIEFLTSQCSRQNIVAIANEEKEIRVLSGEESLVYQAGSVTDFMESSNSQVLNASEHHREDPMISVYHEIGAALHDRCENCIQLRTSIAARDNELAETERLLERQINSLVDQGVMNREMINGRSVFDKFEMLDTVIRSLKSVISAKEQEVSELTRSLLEKLNNTENQVVIPDTRANEEYCIEVQNKLQESESNCSRLDCELKEVRKKLCDSESQLSTKDSNYEDILLQLRDAVERCQVLEDELSRRSNDKNDTITETDCREVNNDVFSRTDFEEHLDEMMVSRKQPFETNTSNELKISSVVETDTATIQFEKREGDSCKELGGTFGGDSTYCRMELEEKQLLCENYSVDAVDSISSTEVSISMHGFMAHRDIAIEHVEPVVSLSQVRLSRAELESLAAIVMNDHRFEENSNDEEHLQSAIDIDQVHLEKMTAGDEITSLSLSLSAKTKELEIVEQERKSLESKNEELMQSMLMRDEDFERMNVRLSEVSSRYLELKDEVKSLTENKDQLTAELAESCLSLEKLNSLLSENSAELENLRQTAHREDLNMTKQLSEKEMDHNIILQQLSEASKNLQERDEQLLAEGERFERVNLQVGEMIEKIVMLEERLEAKSTEYAELEILLSNRDRALAQNAEELGMLQQQWLDYNNESTLVGDSAKQILNDEIERRQQLEFSSLADKRSLEEANEELVKLKEELESSLQHNGKLAMENDTMRQEIEDLKTRLENSFSDKQHIETEYDVTLAKLQDVTNVLALVNAEREKLNDAFRQLEIDLDNQRQLYNELSINSQDEIESFRKIMPEKDEQIEQLTQDSLRLIAQVSDMTNDVTTKEINLKKLQAELSESKESCSVLESNMKESGELSMQLQGQVEEKGKIMCDLQQQLDEKIATCQDLEKLVTETQSRCHELEQVLQDTNDNLGKIEQRAMESDEICQNLRRQLSEKEDCIADCDAEINRLQKHLSDLQNETVTVGDSLTIRLEEEISKRKELEESLQATKHLLDESQENESKLSADFEASQQECSKLNVCLVKNLSNLEQLEQALRNSVAEKHSLENSIISTNTECSKEAEHCRQLESEIEAQKNHFNDLFAQCQAEKEFLEKCLLEKADEIEQLKMHTLSLSSEICVKEDQMEQLKRQHVEVTEAYRLLDESLKDRNANFEQLELQMSETEEKYQNLAKQLDGKLLNEVSIRNEMSQKELRCNELEMVVAEKSRTCEQFQIQTTEVEKASREIRQQLEEQVVAYHGLEMQLTAVKSKCAEYERALYERGTDLDRLRQELQERKAVSTEVLQKASVERDDEIASRDVEILDLQQRLSNAQRESEEIVSTLKNRLDGEIEERKMIENCLQENKQALDESQRRLLNISEQLETSKLHCQQLEVHLAERAKEVETLTSDCTEFISKNRQLESLLASAQDNLEKTKIELASSEAVSASDVEKLKRLEIELDAQKQICIDLSATIEKQSKRFDERAAENDEIIDKLKAQISALADDIRTKENHLECVTNQLLESESREHELNDKLSNMTSNYTQLQIQFGENDKTLGTCKEQLDVRVTSCDHLERELLQLQSQSEEFERLLQERTEQVSQLEMQLAEQCQTYDNLHNILAEKEDCILNMNAEISILQNLVSDLQNNSVSVGDQLKAKLEEEIERRKTLEDTVAVDKLVIDESEEKLVNLSAELSALKLECNRLELLNIEKMEKLQNLDQSLMESTAKVQLLESELDAVMKHKGDVENDLKSVNISFDEDAEKFRTPGNEVETAKSYSLAPTLTAQIDRENGIDDLLKENHSKQMELDNIKCMHEEQVSVLRSSIEQLRDENNKLRTDAVLAQRFGVVSIDNSTESVNNQNEDQLNFAPSLLASEDTRLGFILTTVCRTVPGDDTNANEIAADTNFVAVDGKYMQTESVAVGEVELATAVANAGVKSMPNIEESFPIQNNLLGLTAYKSLVAVLVKQFAGISDEISRLEAYVVKIQSRRSADDTIPSINETVECFAAAGNSADNLIILENSTKQVEPDNSFVEEDVQGGLGKAGETISWPRHDLNENQDIQCEDGHQLEAAIEQTVHRLNKLSQQLHSYELSEMQINVEVRQLTEQLEQKDDKIKSIQTEANMSQLKFDKLREKSIAKVKELTALLKASQSETSKEVEQLKEALEKETQKVMELSTMLEMSRHEIEQLQSDYQRLVVGSRKKAEEFDVMINDKNLQILSLSDTLSQSTNLLSERNKFIEELKSVIDQVTEESRLKIRMLSVELDAATEKISELTIEVATKSERLLSLSVELNANESDRNKLFAEVETMKATAAENCEKLKRALIAETETEQMILQNVQVSEMQRTADNSDKSTNNFGYADTEQIGLVMEHCVGTIRNLRRDIQQRDQSLLVIQETLGEKELLIKKYTAGLKKLKLQLDEERKQKSFKAAMDESVAETEEARQRELDRVRVELSDCEENNAVLQSLCKEKDDKLEISLRNANASFQEMELAKAKVVDCEGKISSLETACMEKEEKLHRLSDSADSLRQALEVIKDELYKRESELISLQQNSNKKDEQLEAVSSKFHDAIDEMNEVKAAVKDGERKIHALQQMCNEKDQQLHQLSAIVEQKSAEIDRLNVAMQESEASCIANIDTLAAANCRVEADLLSQEEEIRHVLSQIAIMTTDRKNLQALIAEKDIALAHVWKVMHTMTQTLDAVNSKLCGCRMITSDALLTDFSDDLNGVSSSASPHFSQDGDYVKMTKEEVDLELTRVIDILSRVEHQVNVMLVSFQNMQKTADIRNQTAMRAGDLHTCDLVGELINNDATVPADLNAGRAESLHNDVENLTIFESAIFKDAERLQSSPSESETPSKLEAGMQELEHEFSHTEPVVKKRSCRDSDHDLHEVLKYLDCEQSYVLSYSDSLMDIVKELEIVRSDKLSAIQRIERLEMDIVNLAERNVELEEVLVRKNELLASANLMRDYDPYLEVEYSPVCLAEEAPGRNITILKGMGYDGCDTSLNINESIRTSESYDMASMSDNNVQQAVFIPMEKDPIKLVSSDTVNQEMLTEPVNLVTSSILTLAVENCVPVVVRDTRERATCHIDLCNSDNGLLKLQAQLLTLITENEQLKMKLELLVQDAALDVAKAPKTSEFTGENLKLQVKQQESAPVVDGRDEESQSVVQSAEIFNQEDAESAGNGWEENDWAPWGDEDNEQSDKKGLAETIGDSAITGPLNKENLETGCDMKNSNDEIAVPDEQHQIIQGDHANNLMETSGRIEDEVAVISAENTKLKIEIELFVEEINKLRQQHIDLKESLETQTSELYVSGVRLERLEAELECLSHDLSVVSEEKSQLLNELAQFRVQNIMATDTTCSETDDFKETRFLTTEEGKESVEEKNSFESKAALHSCKTALGSNSDDEKIVLENELKQLESCLQEKRDECFRQEETISNLFESQNGLIEKVHNLEQRLEEMDQLFTLEKRELQLHIISAEECVSMKEKVCSELEDDLLRVRNEISSLRDENASLLQITEGQTWKLQEFEEQDVELEVARRKLFQLQTENSAVNEKLKSTELELQSMHEDLKANTTSYDKLQDENGKLLSQLEELKSRFTLLESIGKATDMLDHSNAEFTNLETLLIETEALRNQNQNAYAQLERLSEENEKLRIKVQILEDELCEKRRVSDNNGSLSQMLIDAEYELSGVRSALDAALRENARLSELLPSQGGDDSTKCVISDICIESKVDQVLQPNVRVAVVQQSRVEIERHLSTSDQIHESAANPESAQISTLESQNNAMRRELELNRGKISLLDELEVKRKQEAEEFELQIAGLLATKQKMLVKMKELKEKNIELHAQVLAVQEQACMEAARSVHANSKSARLGEELERTKMTMASELIKTKEKLAAMEKDYERADSDRCGEIGRYDALNVEYLGCLQEVEKLMDEICSLKVERDRIEASVQDKDSSVALLSEQIQMLAHENELYKEMVEKCEKEFKNLKEKYTDLDGEKTVLSGKLGQLQEDLDFSRNAIDTLQAENERLIVAEKQLIEMEARDEKLRNETERANARVADIEKELSCSMETSERLRADKEQYENEAIVLRKQVADYEISEAKLAEEKRELEEHVSDLEERLSEMLRVQEELEETINGANKLNDQLAESQKNRASLSEEIDGLTWKIQELEEVKEELDESNAKLFRAQSENSVLKRMLSASEGSTGAPPAVDSVEVPGLKKEKLISFETIDVAIQGEGDDVVVKRLTDDLHDLHDKYNTAVAEKSDLSEQCKRLLGEIEQLKENLNTSHKKQMVSDEVVIAKMNVRAVMMGNSNILPTAGQFGEDLKRERLSASQQSQNRNGVRTSAKQERRASQKSKPLSNFSPTNSDEALDESSTASLSRWQDFEYTPVHLTAPGCGNSPNATFSSVDSLHSRDSRLTRPSQDGDNDTDILHDVIADTRQRLLPSHLLPPSYDDVIDLDHDDNDTGMSERLRRDEYRSSTVDDRVKQSRHDNHGHDDDDDENERCSKLDALSSSLTIDGLESDIPHFSYMPKPTLSRQAIAWISRTHHRFSSQRLTLGSVCRMRVCLNVFVLYLVLLHIYVIFHCLLS